MHELECVFDRHNNMNLVSSNNSVRSAYVSWSACVVIAVIHTSPQNIIRSFVGITKVTWEHKWLDKNRKRVFFLRLDVLVWMVV